MFEWLHLHHDSPELEHAKHRQEERNAQPHLDPVEEFEFIDEEGLIVEEIKPEEFQRLVSTRSKRRA